MFVRGAAASPSPSDAYPVRVASHLRDLDALCRPDASGPRIGDDDSGRIACLARCSAPAVLDAGFAALLAGGTQKNRPWIYW